MEDAQPRLRGMKIDDSSTVRSGVSSESGNDFADSPHPPPLPRTPAPLAYVLIRWLFRFVLGVFYSTVVVEGAENIPEDGVPCMLTANHCNSLTDALLLVTTVPSSRRSFLRLTAKDTQFGRGTFTSWLIESAGTLPIKRPKDHKGEKVDNSVVFATLIRALEKGHMTVLFPEGMSRYWPQIAELKQGVSRIVADTLTRQKDNPKFELAIQTASITYLHRNLFRSDVLVTFHKPIYVSALTHPDLIAPSLPTTPSPTPSAHERAIRSLTATIGTSIRSGILDAPSWSVIRLANTARRLYAPLGTKLSLGDHVRLTQRFVDALMGKRAERTWDEIAGVQGGEAASGLKGAPAEKKRERETRPDVKRMLTEEVLKTPLVEKGKKDGLQAGYFAVASPPSSVKNGDGARTEDEADDEELERLRRDLKTYQDLLYLHGIKDDRIRNPRLLRRRTLLKRLLVRLVGSICLFTISIPGLCLWLPILWMAKREADKLVRKGPVFDTYDEIAQIKLTYGLLTGLAVLTLSSLLTFPFLPFLNLPFLLGLMWLTLRFLEDLFSSLRALLALARLLMLGKRQLVLLRSMRADLHSRVEQLAVERAGLPRDAGVFVRERERRWKRMGLGAVEGGLRKWLGFAAFFDPRRRRKKDWNEALKLFDQTEFQEDAPGRLLTVDGGVTGVVLMARNRDSKRQIVPSQRKEGKRYRLRRS
ncbi:RHTO0S20e01552g1_1 [Rhodotorula toruloides]|uniref:RHTO0S20e01552g1_1 n=1 Tax=Rhodotorula toruloides TaxID=5286 RepID=A0A061BHF0_RHOTO|nr:RHTO0S20e01552g1_1 [Rhodotorula toruloides]